MTTTLWRAGAGLAGLTAAAVLASGCSVAGTQLDPGSAARVGDQRVALSEVDDTVSSYCDFRADNPNQQVLPESRGYTRAQMTAVFIQQAALEQMLDERGLEVGKEYGQALAQFEDVVQAQSLTGVEGLRDINTAASYVDAALVVVGRDALEDDGTTGASDDEASARGVKEFGAWAADHDVDINPLLNLGLAEDGSFTFESDGVSAPVSDAARTALVGRETPTDEQANQQLVEYVSSLPADQRCG